MVIGASADTNKQTTAIIAGPARHSRIAYRHSHLLTAFVQIANDSPAGQSSKKLELTYNNPPCVALWPVMATQGAKMEPGMIMIWSGLIANIPTGWQLCDGTNGTPNLKNQFVIGAAQDDGGLPAAMIDGGLQNSGGAPFHSHELEAGGDIILQAGTGQLSISSDIAYNYPSCVALAYIMKL